MNRIPLIKPFITDEVKARVCAVLDSGYLTEGPVTRELEETFINYTACKYAFAVTSCTTGLEIALRALKVGPGDDVIVPDYTYPATADVVHIVGARTVIVDVSRDTMLIDYDQIEAVISDRTKAIIPVSLFGNPLDYGRLNDLKSRHSFHIVEDAACSIGADYQGTKVGNLADISAFSLHPRKFITTGEGGIVTTNNPEWAQWMNSYKHFGMGMHGTREGTFFDEIGTNYKLSDVLAAIGVVQMGHIHSLLEERSRLATNYYDLLANKPGILLPKTTGSGTHSWQSCTIFVEEPTRVITKMKEKGIETQIGTYALHMHGAFAESPNCVISGDLPGSTYAFEHCLTLPLYNGMSDKEQRFVVEELLKVVDKR